MYIFFSELTQKEIDEILQQSDLSDLSDEDDGWPLLLPTATVQDVDESDSSDTTDTDSPPIPSKKKRAEKHIWKAKK